MKMLQEPKPIEYETPHKTVVLSNPKQLVVKQGKHCINAGTVKNKGKFVPFFLVYDNKPVLVAAIEAWLEAWDAYNEWYGEQVANAKSTMITSSAVNFDEAQNDYFSWTQWDGTSGKILREKLSGREIYQMKYTDNGQSVTGPDRVRAAAFWDALEQIKDQPTPTLTPQEIATAEKVFERLPETNDHPGWCNHCRSYCYGDCQS